MLPKSDVRMFITCHSAVMVSQVV